MRNSHISKIGGNEAVTSVTVQSAMLDENGKHRGTAASERTARFLVTNKKQAPKTFCQENKKRGYADRSIGRLV